MQKSATKSKNAMSIILNQTCIITNKFFAFKFVCNYDLLPFHVSTAAASLQLHYFVWYVFWVFFIGKFRYLATVHNEVNDGIKKQVTLTMAAKYQKMLRMGDRVVIVVEMFR